MISELIVNVHKESIDIAITEDKTLVEYQTESREATFSVGNIYLGRVKRMMPGLNACFVDIGSDKEAFLHFQDFAPNFVPLQKYVRQVQSNRKRLFPYSKVKVEENSLTQGKEIGAYLEQGQQVIVQVAKEPISTKGPRLTAEISFAGRFLILIPFTDKVLVSSKIKSEAERTRLKQLIHSIKPRNCGVIVRTVAENKRVAELDSELNMLVSRWEESIKTIQQTTTPYALLHEESSRTIALLRDLLNPSYESVHINDEKTYREVKEYVQQIYPDKSGIVKLYNGDLTIFDNFGITKQIKSSFGKVVNFKNGAYMVIEHTEALHVVDVNSGHRLKKENQEDNALEVNLGAADELARQLRLRDMGGIIVVDFIDMRLPADRQKLLERMNKNMENDRAKHCILPLSKFGLMQITRQRVRPVMDVKVLEDCPTCFGKGEVAPSILFTDQLANKISYLVNDLKMKRLKLHVHPYVAAYIDKGVVSIKREWQFRYGLGLKVIPNQNLPLLGYMFYDSNNQEVDMKEEHEVL